MKKVVLALNPVFAYAKYLLLTAVLLMATLLFAQMLLRNFNLDASIVGDIKQTLIPFLLTAGVSMIIATRFRKQK